MGAHVRRIRAFKDVALTLTVIHVTFETGCERYKELETGVFVGAGRFVIDESQGKLWSEYRVSKVGWPVSSSSDRAGEDPGGGSSSASL